MSCTSAPLPLAEEEKGIIFFSQLKSRWRWQELPARLMLGARQESPCPSAVPTSARGQRRGW